MFVETYPAAASPSPVTFRRGDSLVFENYQQELNYLYIGSTPEACGTLHSYFANGQYADDFQEARELIKGLNKQHAPDVIFLDLPFSKPATSKFCLFLKDQAFLEGTVIIYNEQKVDIGSVGFLKQNQLVDEVVSINSTSIDYARKVEFLKKVKARQHNLTVSWNGLNRNLQVQMKQLAPLKRSIDIVLALAAIIFFSPLFLLIAIAIRLESRGPIFYNSPRAGKGFKVFKFFKFRTMIVGADKKIQDLAHLNQYTQTSSTGASFMKISNDPRVTKVGKFLRKTSLDEIPQFFNVLKGDMSFVGNRPLPLYEASTLTTNESVERFMAPAGITGLWQIKKRGNENMSVEERINLDISYARRANLIYDLWIMVKTPTALFQKSDA